MSYQLTVNLYDFFHIPFTEHLYIVSTNDESMEEITRLSPDSDIRRNNSFVGYYDVDETPTNGKYLITIEGNGKIFIENKIDEEANNYNILDATSLITPVEVKFTKRGKNMESQPIKVKLFDFRRPKFLVDRANRGAPIQHVATTDICTSKYLLGRYPITKFDKSAYSYFVQYSIPDPKDGYYLIMLSDFESNGETKYNIIVKELL